MQVKESIFVTSVSYFLFCSKFFFFGGCTKLGRFNILGRNLNVQTGMYSAIGKFTDRVIVLFVLKRVYTRSTFD